MPRFDINERSFAEHSVCICTILDLTVFNAQQYPSIPRLHFTWICITFTSNTSCRCQIETAAVITCEAHFDRFNCLCFMISKHFMYRNKLGNVIDWWKTNRAFTWKCINQLIYWCQYVPIYLRFSVALKSLRRKIGYSVRCYNKRIVLRLHLALTQCHIKLYRSLPISLARSLSIGLIVANLHSDLQANGWRRGEVIKIIYQFMHLLPIDWRKCFWCMHLIGDQ